MWTSNIHNPAVNVFKSYVKGETEVTDQFSCEIRVRQGCNLNPLLFSLFISGLESELVKTKRKQHWGTDSLIY